MIYSKSSRIKMKIDRKKTVCSFFFSFINYLLANRPIDCCAVKATLSFLSHSFVLANEWFDCRLHPIRWAVPFVPVHRAVRSSDYLRLEALRSAENIIHAVVMSANCSYWELIKQKWFNKSIRNWMDLFFFILVRIYMFCKMDVTTCNWAWSERWRIYSISINYNSNNQSKETNNSWTRAWRTLNQTFSTLHLNHLFRIEYSVRMKF